MMKPLHYWQKRPVYESRFSYYIRLPIVHWLWRRGILYSDKPLQREGPFYMTGHCGPNSSHHTFADWKREYTAPKRLPDAVRIQRAAWAMERGAKRARGVREHLMHMDA
jgi:hypothetical protein